MAAMHPRDIVRSLFVRPAARDRLDTLGHHIELPTFNLATTSLRHTHKWLDRLQEIEAGQIKPHGNFISDPAALGLVYRTAKGVGLTQAGRSFLSLRDEVYDNPFRAEYELIKVLYSGQTALPSKSHTFVQAKKANLLSFLNKCRPTPQRQMMFQDPRLLSIAEMLAGFEGALNVFFSLSETDLQNLANLGEDGFKSLFAANAAPAGISRICIKIGSDYTRAAYRRRNMIFAMTLLEVWQGLGRRGVRGGRLEIPEPFCNLVSPSDLYEFHDKFTDDLTVAVDENGYIVVRRDLEGAAHPRVRTLTVEAMVRESRKRAARSAGRGSVRRPTGRFFDMALTEEAKRYLQDQILKPKYGKNLVRVGHTDLEGVPLADGMIPGADFWVRKADGSAQEFIEVKSTRAAFPQSIRLTRGEFSRIKRCLADGVPYTLYVVSYEDLSSAPSVVIVKDFAEEIIEELALDHLLSFEIPIKTA
jgi:hypothetical protein